MRDRVIEAEGEEVEDTLCEAVRVIETDEVELGEAEAEIDGDFVGVHE